MKKAYLWILLVILIVVAILAIAFYFITANKSSSTAPSQVTSFPLSGTSTSANTSPTETSNGVYTIPTQEGSNIITLDFLHNGTTIEDPANPGTYYLAGSSGACNSDGTCPQAGTTTNFTILYYPSEGTFNIGLATEPLGEVRNEAEQYLMKALGLTESQMCDLKYIVITTTYVNQQYGGENLGFSFCPGAVPLPQ